MVFIPKVNVYTRGIGTLKILWKVFKTVINTQIKMSVQLHDMLNGFDPAEEWGRPSWNLIWPIIWLTYTSTPYFCCFWTSGRPMTC